MKLKKIFSAALIASGMAAAGSAGAVGIFPEFTVAPAAFGGASLGGTPLAQFEADKITGNYEEVITFVDATTFSVSLLWNAGQFASNDGGTAIGAGATGLGVNYGIYALFTGTGTYSTSGTTTMFNLGMGSLNVFVDPGTGGVNSPLTGPNTTFTPPGAAPTPYSTANSGDDVLIGSGSVIMGNGMQTCTGSNNCGSFGQTTTFALTPTGSSYFIDPVPFYNISLQTGQFNGVPIAVGTSATVNGSLDVVFNRVPEPSTIALFGLALVGLGIARRRKS